MRHVADRLLACALLALAACSSEQTVPVPPQITFDPPQLDFGGLAPGTDASLAIAVVNDNEVAIPINKARLANDSRGTFTIEGTAPTSVAAKARVSLTVKYVAQAVAGSDSATLVVEPGGGASPVSAPLLARTLVASCTDGVRNGSETDTDCGGGGCQACPAGRACVAPTDCVESAGCANNVCGACAESDECRVGLVCRAQACTGCSQDADCASGQTCVAGRCTACPGSQEPIDTRRDVNNCGACGQVCPHPLHATARCTNSKCGRTVCERGWYDIDGERTAGCEAECTGRDCHDAVGNRTTLTSPPLAETGAVGRSLASGGSLGDSVQTNAKYTNLGVLGDATPPALDHQVEQRGGPWRHVGGFQSHLTP